MITNRTYFHKQISTFISKNKYKGSIGVEIELEGKALPTVGFNTRFWKIIPDNSLRDGVELVLLAPVSQKDLKEAIAEYSALTSLSKLKQSLRTSVHVHLNIMSYTIHEVYKLLSLYFLVENVLIRLQGPSRMGNLFCLRAIDSNSIISVLEECIREGTFPNVPFEVYKYGAVNIGAIAKYGSLEFRFLRGMTKAQNIYKWVNGLYEFSTSVRTISCAQTFLDDFNLRNPWPSLTKILNSDILDLIQKKIPEEILYFDLKQGYKNAFMISSELELPRYSRCNIIESIEDFRDSGDCPDENLVTKPTAKTKFTFPKGAGPIFGLTPTNILTQIDIPPDIETDPEVFDDDNDDAVSF